MLDGRYHVEGDEEAKLLDEQRQAADNGRRPPGEVVRNLQEHVTSHVTSSHIPTQEPHCDTRETSVQVQSGRIRSCLGVECDVYISRGLVQ